MTNNGCWIEPECVAVVCVLCVFELPLDLIAAAVTLSCKIIRKIYTKKKQKLPHSQSISHQQTICCSTITRYRGKHKRRHRSIVLLRSSHVELIHIACVWTRFYSVVEINRHLIEKRTRTIAVQCDKSIFIHWIICSINQSLSSFNICGKFANIHCRRDKIALNTKTQKTKRSN